MTHSLAEGAVLAAIAALATWVKGRRRIRAVMASLGLITSSALLVHLSGGYIELHFHFFVMIAIIALYQDWIPFLLTIGYVVVHHGLLGALYPDAVYNHPDAWASPWKWAAIHGVFVLAASIASIVNWRLSELARIRSELAEQEVRNLNAELEERVAERTTQLEVVIRQLREHLAERQRAEEAWCESEARFRAIFESTAVGIVQSSAEGRLIDANPALQRMLGYSASELVGRPFAELTHPDDLEVNLEYHRGLLEGRRDRYELEKRYHRKDGSWLWIHQSVSRVCGPNSEPRFTFAMVQDITARKQAEKALRESNHRLETALAELKATQQQAIQQERLRALGEMASGIAHDFNNTLAQIVGFSELLLVGPDDLNDKAKTREYLGFIHNAAEDGAKVVGRVREFYRRRDPADDFRPIDLSEVAQQVVALTRPRWRDEAQARGLEVRIVTDLQPGSFVLGSEAELREAVTNLILNALDAMPEGGTIALRTKADDDQVLLEITDSGSGMSEEVCRRCPEPFFTTKGEGGTGLGLSMVHGTVRRHEGTIDIQSERGAGTTVSLHLPRTAQQAALASAPPEAVAKEPALRLLVVDDEPRLLVMFERFLALDGHAVETAANGRDGVAKVRPGAYDLVITDRSMPGLSGDQVAAAVKQIAPQTPVIMVTGFGDLMTAVNERPTGVDLILKKPFTLTELRNGISTAVNLNGARGCHQSQTVDEPTGTRPARTSPPRAVNGALARRGSSS